MSKKTGLKWKIRIFNIFIAVICAISILAYYPISPIVDKLPESVQKYVNRPFIGIEVTLTVDKDMLSEVLGEQGGEGNSSFNLDYGEIVGDGLDISVGVSITSDMLIKAVKLKDEEAEAFVNDTVLAPNINSILDKAMETVRNDLMPKLVKFAAKSALTTALLSEGSELSEAQAEEVAQAVEAIYEVFTGEDATVDEFTDTLIEQIDNLSGSEAFKDIIGEDFDFSDEQKEELKEEMTDMLDQLGLVGENGEIKDLDAVLSALLSTMNGESSGDDKKDESGSEPERQDPPQESSANSNFKVNFKFGATKYEEEPSTEPEPEAETEESLEDQIRSMLLDKLSLSEETLGTIAKIFKYISYFYLFLIATWAWVLLKILLKFFLAKNPGVKLGLPIILGWIPQILCWLVSLVYLLKDKGLLAKLGSIGDTIGEMLGKINVSLISSALIPAICAGVLFILSFFYAHTRRKLKKAIRRAKIKGED